MDVIAFGEVYMPCKFTNIALLGGRDFVIALPHAY